MRLLITAFEPFASGPMDAVGLWRKYLLRRNASLDVLRLLQAEPTHADCDFRVLAVSDAGERQLERALGELDPAGVVSLGEHFGLDGAEVNLEPFAVDAPVQRGGDPGGRPRIDSPFTRSLAGGRGLVSSIGTYYCNRIYGLGLKWAAARGNRPVAFIHVPVWGRRSSHAEQSRAVIAAMRRELAHGGAFVTEK